MNNAANSIDATSKSLKQMLFETHYKVGYFQREYKWQRGNVEDLLIDLERSFNSNWSKSHSQKDVATYDKYYMGPIVLYVDKAEFSIVDGQQRLTSFILLMIFLNSEYEKLFKIKDKFKGYIFSDYFGTESYNMNIEERTAMLDHLFKRKIFDEKILKNESCKAIYERYNDIIELFPKSLLDLEIFPLFTNWLTEKLVFIEILTQTSESAYTIFETMNDRGLNLTQTELLKSFLLSNVKDEEKIKELDLIWKSKVSLINSIDDDQDFFKAWLRGKYAVTIRSSEKDSENKDFEKIGTRFSSWTQENTKIKELGESKLLLDTREPSSFYFFVKSDFNFFSDLYIKLKNLETSETIPEHRFRLLYYKGMSPSLSYPLILAPIKKTDGEEIITNKIEFTVNYIDCYGVYRILLGEPITHGSIRNSIYIKIKEFRNLDLVTIKNRFEKEILEYKVNFLKIPYTRIDSNSRYILSRLYIYRNPSSLFENIYFQRKKDSFVLYQFLKLSDFEVDKMNLPSGLRDILINSLCSMTLVPKHLVGSLDGLPIVKRIQLLLKENFLVEFQNLKDFDPHNLKEFFIKKEKKLKELIINLWKV